MAKGDKWTTVMLKRTTLARLKEVQGVFNSQYLKGQLLDVPCHDRFGISLDTVIQILVSRDQDHRARARKNSRPPATPPARTDAQGPVPDCADQSQS